MQTDQLQNIVLEALDDLKAINVRVLDVRKLTTITDLMIVCTGRSNRHVKSIADNVVKVAKENGVKPLGLEGIQQAEWVLVDLADIIIHIMLPDTREHYHLEKLWSFNSKTESMQAQE